MPVTGNYWRSLKCHRVSGTLGAGSADPGPIQSLFPLIIFIPVQLHTQAMSSPGHKDRVPQTLLGLYMPIFPLCELPIPTKTCTHLHLMPSSLPWPHSPTLKHWAFTQSGSLNLAPCPLHTWKPHPKTLAHPTSPLDTSFRHNTNVLRYQTTIPHVVLPTPHVRATPPILPHPKPHSDGARSTR